MTQQLRNAWNFIRWLATDDAYDRYLAHHAQAHSGAPPMDRRSFYLREQNRKWNGVQRCC